MTQRVLIYRLPNASFPVKFEMLGEVWELQVRPVEHGTFWAAQFVGPSRWHLTHAYDKPSLLSQLQVNGVEVGHRSFVATLVMRLEHIGAAELV